MDDQVRRLIFFMPGAGVVEIGQLVERKFAVALGFAEQVSALAAVSRKLVKMLHARMTGMCGINLMQAAAAGELLQGRVQQAGNQPVLKALMEVAHLPQFVLDPAGVYALFVVPELGRAEIVV